MESAPVIKSFLIADSVFQSSDGKWCIIGIFDRIFAPSFPALHYSLGVFIRLADAEGDYKVDVEFYDSSNRCLAKMTPLQLQVSDRTSEFGFGIQTYGLPIPGPGIYFLKVLFNGEPAVGDIRLEACLSGGKTS